MYTLPAGWPARTVFCFWIALLAMAALAVSTPVPEPAPVPIEPGLASILGSKLNLGCQNGCPAAAGAQTLDKNAALGSAALSPLSVLGGLAVASGILASI